MTADRGVDINFRLNLPPFRLRACEIQGGILRDIAVSGETRLQITRGLSVCVSVRISTAAPTLCPEVCSTSYVG